MKWNMIDLGIIPSAAQFRNVLLVGKVAKIQRKNANEAYISKHVSRFFMKSNNTMTLSSQDVLY